MQSIKGMQMIVLDVYSVDQRRYYSVEFFNGTQALSFIEARKETHAFAEDEENPIIPMIGPVSQDVLALYDYLYPQCEHGLSAALCGGPMHWYDPS
jgi:hypothetical protein